MKSKIIHQDAEKTWALIFETGEEVTAGLKAFARQQQLSANHFTPLAR